MNQTLEYLTMCGFEISETMYDDEHFYPYKEVTHPNHLGKIFKYTPEHAQDINGPQGTVDMLPIVKKEVEDVFGFTLPKID